MKEVIYKTKNGNEYLIHKSGYSGGFISKNGRSNNSSAYNHDYYMKNKDKWGIDDSGENEYREEDHKYAVVSNKDKTTIYGKKTTNKNEYGYGIEKYSYTEKNNKTGKSKTVDYEEKVTKGKSWFTQKRTIDMGNKKYVTIEKGKIAQGADRVKSWLKKKVKK